MELSYKQVSEVFGLRYGIQPSGGEGAVAFRARLQHLQRNAFPSGVNTGKGKRAAYGWEQLIELSVALDLIDLGLTPDLVRSLVLGEREHILTAARLFRHMQGAEQLCDELLANHHDFDESMILSINTNSLSNLADSQKSIRLNYLKGHDFVEGQLRSGIAECDDFSYPTHTIVIDLGRRLFFLFDSIAAVLGQQSEKGNHHAVLSSFIEWRDAYEYY